ncbi:MlaD family protein [Nocardioides sp.]|uniref:MlaD family protein n=1 Tax=Nocardioides sp. TaxID=35761 RepID=UPI00321B4628
MRRQLPAVLAGLLVIAAVGFLGFRSDGYQVQVGLASATNVVEGGPVLVNGFESGTVDKLEVVDGMAVVTMTLDDEVAPLHSGAEVVVDWKATLSERQLEITDGATSNAEIPEGGMIPGEMPKPTEIDDILNALDEPTRKDLQSLLAKLAPTLQGNEQDLRATITTGGPTLEALGQVLRALGTDGPAIKNLVSRLDEMLTIVAERDDEVTSIVDRLHQMSQDVSSRRESLRATLTKLPGTLEQAERTLGLVPSVADEAVPLLNSLEPVTAKLKPVAANLRPVLADLRPLVADLRPMLDSTRELLTITPGLLDTGSSLLPEAREAVDGAREPVAFLRPYTPEVLGFFSTWASAFSNYDSNGNFARIFGQAGPTSVNENPGVVPPGVTYDPYPEPGAVVGQAWTDAYGSGMR